MSTSSALRARNPAFAGSFYPAEPTRLRAMVDRLLAHRTRDLPPVAADAVAGILVPHAGLEFSGAIAALGWVLVAGAEPASVVLLGTDHHGRRPGARVWTGGAWYGPWGSVETDAALTERVLALGSPFEADDEAHLDEHSIEVQLPLLARAAATARIVPILVSGPAWQTERIGDLLGQLLRDEAAAGRAALLVASSDFAHYPPAWLAEEVTRRLVDPITALDAERLRDTELAILRDRHPGLVCGMCGIDPTCALLAALQRLGAACGVLLGAATSADALAGEHQRTVGYAAVAFVR